MTRLNQDHRRILLIDQNRTKQNLRATILRNYEIEVHTADNPREASALWTRYSYELVLLAAPEDSEEAVEVSARIRQVHPRQRIGLLVGPPVFIRDLGGRGENLRGEKPTPSAWSCRAQTSKVLLCLS
jgi:CheY-like chemotaxis protein